MLKQRGIIGYEAIIDTLKDVSISQEELETYIKNVNDYAKRMSVLPTLEV